MGTLGNGDGGPYDDLPELPPEWGPIRIPDDPSELAEEAARVRRELREGHATPGGAPRPSSTPPPFGGSAVANRPDSDRETEPASLRIPLLIMTAALLAAVIGLFVSAWPDARREPGTGPAGDSATSRAATRAVPALDLFEADGTRVPLGSLLPAVIVLTDRCQCAPGVAAIAAAAPADVTVVTVTGGGSDGGATPAPPTGVRALRDPGDDVLAFLGLGAEPTSAPAAPVALIGRSGELVRVVDSSMAVDEYATELTTLTSR